jgi:hypothetical protein
MALQGTLQELTELALTVIQRRFPFFHGQLLRSEDDLENPSQLPPVFCGAFDWHSAVHGHWTLVRALHVDRERTQLTPEHAADIEKFLDRSFDRKLLEQEVQFADEHRGFEIPYGRSWLLILCAELRQSSSPLLDRMIPLEQRARRDLIAWCDRLTRPIRSGQHDQSMYSLGMFHDWAAIGGDDEVKQRIEKIALRHHADDVDLPLHLEPSNHDFLSPTLATADLMRRVLTAAELTDWLKSAAPALLDGSWPTAPVTCPDPSDGKLSHLDGLNLSRAAMLHAIAETLGDHPAMAVSAKQHADAGWAGIDPTHYAGAHWLASFAMYLETKRWRVTP